MNAIPWVFVAGLTGWLTGRFIENKRYGKALGRRYGIGLDIGCGILGAGLGSWLFFSTAVGRDASFGSYGIAVLGSFALVTACRLVSAKYFPSPYYRNMSRAAFIEWQDNLAVEELARWEPPRKETGPTPMDGNDKPVTAAVN